MAMKAVPDISINNARQTAARSFLGAMVFLCFFVYPLGIFPPTLKIGQTIFFNLNYNITIPGTIILSLLAVPILLFFNWRLNRLVLTAVMVFSVMLLWNMPRDLEYLDEFLMLTGYVTIPIAAAILLKTGHLTLNRIAGWASALWVVEILLGGIALYRQTNPVGTPGNINWMAGLLLMLSPWVIWFFIKTARFWIKNRSMALLLAILVWLVPTTFILYHCHSRTAWLAICLLPPGLAVVRLRRPMHKILLTGILILAGIGCLMAAYLFFPVHLLRVVEKDVRVPLWTGTGVMIVKHPLGVGSGEYQKHFTPLRRVSSYHHRLYAADMTVHPHNEILNVGAQLGIPALLAFLIMISQIGRSAFKDPLHMCARISGYFIIISAMFDMLLVQPPTNFIGLFILGLCWPIQVGGSHTGLEKPKLLVPKALFSGLIMAGVLIYCAMDFFHDVHMRRGILAEHTAKAYMDLNRHDEARKSQGDAVTMYKKSVNPFSSIIPFYEIGRLSLSLPGNTDQAEAYLNRVAAMDPDFSHLNLLFGRLSLQQRNLAAAQRFFTRECHLYPRSEKAWQNMYTFSAGTSQYDRVVAIDALLGDIYRERARQNLGETGLNAKQEAFAKAMHDGNPTKALEVAEAFLTRINHRFTDPLFLEITKGQAPSFFFNSFDAADSAMWNLRYTIFSFMEKELGPLPATPRALVSWYTRLIQIQDTLPLTLPAGAWNRRTGSPLSVYLLFAVICELNQTPSIICLDADRQPALAYLFVKNTAPDVPGSENPAATEKIPARVTIFCADLQASTCKTVPAADFRQNFRWKPGHTLVYYPPADYFLRNQILGILVNDHAPYLPQHLPSIRLLEIFMMTGTPPPLFPMLKNYCFDKHIRQMRPIPP